MVASFVIILTIFRKRKDRMKGRGNEGTFLLIWPRDWGAWACLFGEGRLCNKVKEIVILSSFPQLRNRVSPLLMKEH